MEIEQYRFIYGDLKQQIKEIPPLQDMLRLTQKSTKKLQCLNLYSISDKREFDLELEEEQIMKQILQLSQQVNGLRSTQEYELILETTAKIEQIKTKNIEIFDLLTRQDEILTKQIELVQYYFGDEDHNDNQIKIKEEDEFQDQYGNIKDSVGTANNYDLSSQDRITKLKHEIQQIGVKISKINGGRGKWYATDHKDFIKIYNKCAGNTQKLVDESVKVLGMKNTQIMDHLEIYEKYLQLQKQKKIVAEEYRQIKLYEQIEQDEKKQRQEKLALQNKKLKKERDAEQNQRKRHEIMKYKQKKHEQKIKMLQEHERKEKQKIIRIPIPAAKKKEIIERNQKYISDKKNNFKKQQVPQESEIKGNPTATKGSYSKGKVVKVNSKSRSLVKNTEAQTKN